MTRSGKTKPKKTKPENGKHARVVKQTSLAATFLVPVLFTGVLVALTVAAYEPLTFDGSTVAGVTRAHAEELQTAEATGEKTSAEPETDANYSASDYGIDASNLQDGTYTGSAYGFKSAITVAVTVQGGKITNIQIVSQADDALYFNRARSVISSVLSAQTTNVDTVSGATYSSKGILMAIRNALVQAQGGSASATQLPSADSSTEKKPASVPDVPEGTLKDGTYVGKGMGFNDYIQVAVTIANGTINGIEIVDEIDDEPYFTNASAVMKSVLDKQSVNVDTVSGATYSSKGILAAIADALNQALDSGDDKGDTGKDDKGDSGSDKGDTGKDDKGDTGDKGDGGDNPGGTDPDTPGTTDPSGYLDGSYTATAFVQDSSDPGRFTPYYVQVTVQIENGKVATISEIKGVNGYDEDQNATYLDYAIYGRTLRKVTYVGVRDQLLGGSAASAIAPVSGATYSSRAIANAYAAALEKAAAAYKEAHANDAQASNAAAGTGAVSGSSADASASAGGNANA